METNRIRQFRVVVEAGNLRKASDLLRISHGGLSKSMKALETELGFKLLLPSGRGIAITDAGNQLYARSASFLNEVDLVMGATLKESRKILRLGSFEVFTSQFIARLMAESFREVDMEVHELVPGRLEEALLSQRIDVGITYEPVPRKGITYTRTTSLVMAPYVLKNAFRERPTLEIPFVVPVKPIEGIASGVKGLDGWPEGKFQRQTPYGVDLLSTALELVRLGLCAVFVPEFVARLHNEVVTPEFQLEARELPKGMKPVRRDIFLLKREATEEDRSFQLIAKSLRRL